MDLAFSNRQEDYLLESEVTHIEPIFIVPSRNTNVKAKKKAMPLNVFLKSSIFIGIRIVGIRYFLACECEEIYETSASASMVKTLRNISGFTCHQPFITFFSPNRKQLEENLQEDPKFLRKFAFNSKQI